MKIILACNAGMSTSMMKMKLEQETANRGISSIVKAVPISEIEEYMDETDVLLLGPQIRFIEKEMREQYPDMPIVVMDMKEYGSMNANSVLDRALLEIASFTK
ncbi:PTS sugar transporter subunit IIB [Amedibacillus sp. YH-ame6]